MQDAGADVNSDLQDRIDELEDELQEGKLDMKILKAEKSDGNAAGKREVKDSNKELEEADKELKKAEKIYRNVVNINRDVKRAIEAEIKAIVEDIIPELRREIINGKRFEKAKKKLEAKIKYYCYQKW